VTGNKALRRDPVSAVDYYDSGQGDAEVVLKIMQDRLFGHYWILLFNIVVLLVRGGHGNEGLNLGGER